MKQVGFQATCHGYMHISNYFKYQYILISGKLPMDVVDMDTVTIPCLSTSEEDKQTPLPLPPKE